MIGEMLDTSPEKRDRYYELLRRLGPRERGLVLASLCKGGRDAAEAGIRRLHPGIGSAELKLRLTARLYGAGVARRLHGKLPPDLE
ncbi:MAG TPA: hypothetical protein VH208_06725 [Myxococcaceae bacterium]|nr:hypothetical protein [Myxococcaceae bacterium]